MMNRRHLLSTFLGAGAISLLPGSPSPAAGSKRALDLTGSRDLLTALVKLSGSLDERMTIWWMEGLRYGVVDDIATPTFGFQIGFFNFHQRIDDDAYRVTQMELTYYTDLETGELLRTYDNPYTGKTNKVIHVRFGPMIRTQTAEGLLPAQNEASAVQEFNAQVGPATRFDGDVWIPTAVAAKVELPFPNKPTLALNQHTTFHGQASDIDDPDIKSAPARLIFNNAISWEPWLLMWDHPGYSMGRAWGRKLFEIGQLPERYLALAREVHPDLIEDPYALLRATADGGT